MVYNDTKHGRHRTISLWELSGSVFGGRMFEPSEVNLTRQSSVRNLKGSLQKILTDTEGESWVATLTQLINKTSCRKDRKNTMFLSLSRVRSCTSGAVGMASPAAAFLVLARGSGEFCRYWLHARQLHRLSGWLGLNFARKCNLLSWI